MHVLSTILTKMARPTEVTTKINKDGPFSPTRYSKLIKKTDFDNMQTLRFRDDEDDIETRRKNKNYIEYVK